MNIPLCRLSHQQIFPGKFSKPEDLVSWMGAMQAQDYQGAKWAIGLRLQEGSETEIDHAIAGKEIVRCWMLRGTLHFVAGKDFHWMRELVAPRLIAGSARRRADLELDDKILAQSRKIIAKALQGGKQVLRQELLDSLEAKGIRTDSQRGYHILWNLALHGIICFSSHQGKQPSFALADQWLPERAAISREEALARLSERYFQSHGPATVPDFTWWSGLKTTEVRQGMGALSSKLQQEKIGEKEFWFMEGTEALKPKKRDRVLLPGFDEYFLGYTDRTEVLDAKYFPKIVPGNNGMFMPMMVEKGRVVGTWKKEWVKKEMSIRLLAFEKFSAGGDKNWKTAIQSFADFYPPPRKGI